MSQNRWRPASDSGHALLPYVRGMSGSMSGRASLVMNAQSLRITANAQNLRIGVGVTNKGFTARFARVRVLAC
jgi:cobalamin biosynthesis protein CobT